MHRKEQGSWRGQSCRQRTVHRNIGSNLKQESRYHAVTLNSKQPAFAIAIKPQKKAMAHPWFLAVYA